MTHLITISIELPCLAERNISIHKILPLSFLLLQHTHHAVNQILQLCEVSMAQLETEFGVDQGICDAW